jgi:hypothetical protein
MALDKTLRNIVDQFVRPKPTSILYNRFLLYFVFFIAIGNLFFATVARDYTFVVYFVLIGVVISFFNKNMTVILVLTLAFANILKLTGKHRGLEGMENADNEEEDKEKKEEKPTAKSSTDPKDTATKKQELVGQLKTDAEQLIEHQKNIIDGFDHISPEMDRAEKLIEKLDNTAKQIQSITDAGIQGFRDK